MSIEGGDEPRMQADWKGISAPVAWMTSRAYGDGWLAVGTDPQDGTVAVSVWEANTNRREVAVWLTADSVRKLIVAMTAALGQDHKDA